MSLKKIVFILLITAYAIYYAVISQGFIKKDFVVENGTILERAIAYVTPLSPEEKNTEIKESIEILNLHLATERDNLSRYEEWLAKVTANPPS